MTIYTASSRSAATWREENISWRDMAVKLSQTKRTRETVTEYQAMTRDQKAEVKDVGGFVAGEIYNGIRKKANIRNRCIIVLDVDYGDNYVWDDVEMMLDCECLMHTTHSHTPEEPRYRLFFPLSHVIPPEQYEPIARRIAEEIGLERFDTTTYDYARLMFWPSTCADGEFKAWHQEGPLLDPDEVLATYKDWRNQSEWPRSKRENREMKNDYEHKAKQENPLHKGGVVGAFCRVYSIPEAIDKYLSDKYVEVEGMADRYTYTGGTTTGGMVVYDDGLFAYSHHDTDPAHGRTCNAYDLVRIHLYGDTEESTARMKALCHEDEAVRRELEVIAKENANREFENKEIMMFDQDYTEQGNGNILCKRASNIIRWSAATGWLFWDGVVWVPDAEMEVLSLVKNLNDDILAEAKAELQLATEKTEQKAAMQKLSWANKGRKYSTMAGVIKLAASALKLRDTRILDHEPWLLNTPDAIYDLHDGRRLPHESRYMCTKVTAYSPDWSKPAPMWEDFLRKLTGGDKEYERYLQMIAGMACVGQVYEEGVIIAYGPGGNGKSTLFSIWKQVLGDYAGTVRNEVLVGLRNGGEVPGQIQLRGLRLAIASELEESTSLQSSLLKKLTSRDDICARPLYHEPVVFTPSHTLILHTNHMPKLKSLDEGTRRRLAVCPFLMKLEPGETRTDFANELLAVEGPQVLAWMIDGAKRFSDANMHVEKPAVVRNATDNYVEGEDKVLAFIEDCCERGEGKSCGATALYQAYRRWCGEQGYHYMVTQKEFSMRIAAKGFEKTRKSSGLVYLGLDLTEEYAL